MNEIRQITLKYILFMELNRIVCHLSLTLKILIKNDIIFFEFGELFVINQYNINEMRKERLNLNFLM